MTTKILFAAGDVGGARALIPVIRAAVAQGHPILVLRHGHISQEADPNWQWLESEDLDAASLDALVSRTAPDVMVFASSLKDFVALSLARSAQAHGIKVVHILDSWTTYQQRMMLDGLPPLSPEIYAVMDETAADAAAEAGISKNTIHVTGHPALGDMMASAAPPVAHRVRRRDGIKNLLFISEPVEVDQGLSDRPLSYRGYTEREVIQLLCNALQPMAGLVFISILPHPREDELNLKKIWEANCKALQGVVLSKMPTTKIEDSIDAVVGMASILLYEAWLLGRPALSLQPGLQQTTLRQFGLRPDLLLIDSYEEAGDKIRNWVETINPLLPATARPEARVHVNAAQNVLSLALELATASNEKGN